MEVKGRFAEAELVILNVTGPGEDWANDLCGAVKGLQAPDYDGTTSGDSGGISVLVPRADLADWKAAAEELGLTVAECNHKPEAGHYGDGQWAGVDLAHCGDWLYWIEL